MFLTGSVRRKMSLILGGVAVTFLLLALSGVSGLVYYRNAVNDLEFSIHHAPRRADLAAAIGGLFEPLLYPPADNAAAARDQQQELAKRVAAAQQAVLEFRRRLGQQPATLFAPGAARIPVTEAILGEVDFRLQRMAEMLPVLLEDARRPVVVTQMLHEVALMETRTQQVPDSQDGLSAALVNARRVHRWLFWTVCVTTVGTVFVFVALFQLSYRWIFAPIRVLHQGAARVAQGDFDYRVRLNTDDEMAELAESFNKMTTRFQEIAADLDEQVQQRSRQLVRSERLAGVGFLAAGVAHEINNPLSAIAMASESVEGRLSELLAGQTSDDVEVVRKYLSMIQREAFRCREITQRMLDFARRQEGTRTETDLVSIVNEVLALVSHLGKYRDRAIDFAPLAACRLEVNETEIKQVVLNLVANALESMDAGGRLRISVVEQTDGAWLTFEDDGCGMTDDTLVHLFEPFFTRRKGGKGTGLGLSISHSIIADHGGRIEVSSGGVGRGSTFRVYLPRRTAVTAAA